MSFTVGSFSSFSLQTSLLEIKYITVYFMLASQQILIVPQLLQISFETEQGRNKYTALSFFL